MRKINIKGVIKIPAKASVWYLGVSAVTKAVGIVTTPFFTRLLDGEAYGQFALYMTLLGGASVICSAFSSGSAFYTGLKKNENEKYSFYRAVLAVSIGASLLICLLLFAFSSFFELKRVYYIPLTLQLLCDGITAVMLSSARFYYKYKTVAAVSLTGTVLPPLISIYALTRADLGYSVRIYSLLFVSAFIAIYLLLRLLRIRNSSGEKSRPLLSASREVLRLSLPMLPHGISSAVTIQADKLIITALMGAVALGKYSVIYSMGVALQFAVTAIGSALSPWMIRRLEAGEGEKISELILPMTLGYSALGLCLIAAAPEALAILAPSEYFEAFPALLPIALSTPFYFLSTVSTVGIVYSERTKYSLCISAVSALTCVILNYTLIGKWSYLGAGLAFLACQAVSAVLGIILLSRAGLSEMIDKRKTLIALLISLPFGIVISSLSSNIWARAVMLIIPALLLLYCLFKGWPLVVEKGRKMLS